MNYSLLRSKTFWSVVAMAVVGGGNAILPIIPADYQALVMLVLGGLASYFHLSTAKAGNVVN